MSGLGAHPGGRGCLPLGPDYTSALQRNRLVLWSPNDARAGTLATIRDLALNTCSPCEVILASSRELEEELADAVACAGIGLMRIPNGADAAFASAICSAWKSGAGLYFVEGGTRLPFAWDLRLRWTAERAGNAGAVSPLAVLRKDNNPGVDEWDAAAYLHNTCQPIEVPPLFNCIYVTSAAVRLIGDHWKLRPWEASCECFPRALSMFRFQSVLADHIAVVVAPSRFRSEVPQREVAGTIGRHAATTVSFSVRPILRPRHLHVLHSWGGGLARWVSEYANADHEAHNFLLKSIGMPGAFGSQLWLFRSAKDRDPVRRYPVDPPIASTALASDSYRSAITSILDEFGIEDIIVSSLIGHSLDVFRTGRPTVMVCHDYYPFCPALNITFGSVCRQCSEEILCACTQTNSHNRFFLNVPVTSWLELRSAFSRTILECAIPLIAPSQSVQTSYSTLDPTLADAFEVIPHGSRRIGQPLQHAEPEPGRRPRVVVVGSLSANKGLDIVREIAPALAAFADLYLVGSGSEGAEFSKSGRIRVIEKYTWHELPRILAEIDPDLALLPSVVPETFSFTLQELFDLCVPVVATRLGSFADRITDGVNGFLCDPSGPAILSRIRHLAQDRRELKRVRHALHQQHHRPMEEMLGQYREILGCARYSARGYFCVDTRRHHRPAEQLISRLYWRSGQNGFTEESSVSVRCPVPAQRSCLTLTIPPVSGLSGLRLDVVVAHGAAVVHEFCLRDEGGRDIWNWVGDRHRDDSDDWPPDGSVYGAFVDGLIVCAGGEGGHGILHLPARVQPLVSRGGTFTLVISSLTPDEAIELIEGESSGPTQHPGLAALLSRMIGMRKAAAAGSESQNTDLLLAHRRIRELESSLSWRITQPLRFLADRLSRLIPLWRARKKLGLRSSPW